MTLERLIETLAPAAARGVDVTIVTNDHEPSPLTLAWQQVVKRDHALVTFKGAGYELQVIDCDGDFSEWTLKRHGKLIVEGSRSTWKPYYHCDQCCLDAEKALRLHVRARIAALRASDPLNKEPAR